MKSRLLVLLLTAVIVTLTSGRDLQAYSTEFWNTGNITTISHNTLPQIKGNCLVWQGRGGLGGTTSGSGDWEIFLYNMSTDTTVQITDDDYDDISPQTDGDYVVWQKHDPVRTNQIFLYKVNSAGSSMISNDDDKDNYSPQIAAGRVVWTSQRVAHSFEPGEIMLYDAKNATGPVSISSTTLDCSAPRMNSKTVIWLQAAESGTTALYMYDLATGNSTSAPEGYIWSDSPQSDGGLTVLTRYDGSDREIFVYNNCAKTYEQITDNGLEDTYPRISGNYAVWVRGEGETSEVVLASGLPVVPCADAGCDEDGDGVCGDVDNCPSTPNPEQEDSDGDGVGDVCDSDSCPNDPNKTEPGVCGCGTPDTDSDGDGTPDCIDAFPDDPDEWLDTDEDGIGNNADLDDDNDDLPDTWEESYGLDPLDDTGDNGKDGDFDHDGRTNYQEFCLGSNPNDQNGVSVNSPPFADAGSDQTVEEGSTVALDGSGSEDPDDGIASYRWRQVGETSLVTLFDPTAKQTSFVTPPIDVSKTTLIFELTVEDNEGLQHTDEVSVTVSDNGIEGFPVDVITTTCSTGEPIGLQCGSGANMTSLDTAIDPDTLPDEGKPQNLIYGLIGTQIKVDTAGSTVTVTMYFLAPVSADYRIFKYGYRFDESSKQYETQRSWYDYSDHVIFNTDRTQLTFSVTDGGIGDDDRAVNGKIADPFGLGTPPQTNPGDDGGNCFIATAAFGSYVDPHVQVLRDFRDEYLLTNMPGRWFVNIYYTYGPFWADQLNAHPGCKPFVRIALMPVVGISYFVLNAALATKLLTGFLLLGFIPICLLRLHGRSVTRE